MENKVSFKADLVFLPSMLEWFRHHLEAPHLSDVEVMRIEVALEEGLVNIISYAYQGEVGMIDLMFHHEKGEFIELTIIDSGHPFNPLKHKKEIDPNSPVEELEVGGLGILFMQKLMDKVEYHRDQDKNILVLRKNL